MNLSKLSSYYKILLVSTTLIIGCNPVSPKEPTSPEKPSLSNLISYKGDNSKMLTAYYFPGNDSLPISFSCNGYQSVILIESSLDSGKSWITIKKLQPSGSQYTYYWSPVNDMKSEYEFCGGKNALIRVKCGDSKIVSDTFFAFLGSIPVILESPKPNDEFLFNSKVSTVYTCNMHFVSKIQTYFKTDNDNDTNWIEFKTEDSFNKSFDNTILNMTTSFSPADYPDKADIFSNPLMIMIKDYSAPNIKPIIVRPINIKK